MQRAVLGQARPPQSSIAGGTGCQTQTVCGSQPCRGIVAVRRTGRVSQAAASARRTGGGNKGTGTGTRPRAALRALGQQDRAETETIEASTEGVVTEGGVGWGRLVSLCTISSVICTIDRAAMSVAIIPMSEEFGWTEEVKGVVSSAFFGGYTLTNFAGGYLTALFPAATLLGVGVVLWSGFTMLTPVAAATRSMPVLMGCRASMGVSEGVAFPSYTSLYATHIPKDKRSRAQAFLYSGQQLGTIIALLTAPKIIQIGGWEAVFYFFGSLGLAWAAAWAPVARRLDSSRTSSSSPPVGDQQGVEAAKPSSRTGIPWGEIASNKAAFSLAVAHCSCGFGLFIYQAWLPSFCAQQYDLSLETAATLAIFPWLVQSVTTAGAGILADNLINSGTLTRTEARKVMQTVGSLMPAMLLAGFAIQPPTDEIEGLGLLTVVFAALGLQGAGFGGNHADISPKYAGAMFGVTNAMASICGTLGIYLTGTILQASDGDWSPTFAIISGVYVAGWAFFMAWGSGEEQEFNNH